MRRASVQTFNLSFLDLLTGALGAVIFLFIVTPKGGEAPAIKHQMTVSIDTLHRVVFGSLHDSIFHKTAGDTLLVLIKDYKALPGVKNCPECPEPMDCPEPIVKYVTTYLPSPSSSSSTTENNVRTDNVSLTDVNTPSTPRSSSLNETAKEYKGDPPSVPCQVSFEINWKDKKDNVDFFVCKGDQCVYGKKMRNKQIGQWDSGKSKNTIFRADLRTTQEAVRQFDGIIPGRYQLYAQFKDSNSKKNTVNIKGLIYTRSDAGKERGDRFYKSIPLDRKKRTLLGTVDLQKDGSFTFNQK